MSLLFVNMMYMIHELLSMLNMMLHLDTIHSYIVYMNWHLLDISHNLLLMYIIYMLMLFVYNNQHHMWCMMLLMYK